MVLMAMMILLIKDIRVLLLLPMSLHHHQINHRHHHHHHHLLPRRVFEYFASIRNPSGEVYMTPADLMRAVVPVFPPSESNRVREGSLRGEQNYGVKEKKGEPRTTAEQQKRAANAQTAFRAMTTTNPQCRRG
ncbi:hypothetical protein RIF29_07626 [Crotalaria pallida]|uniref:Secreted protein n=1 Tax=Crotalaria pallida TaxID=3830 RepID=A0AAN9J751_CROPI